MSLLIPPPEVSPTKVTVFFSHVFAEFIVYVLLKSLPVLSGLYNPTENVPVIEDFT